MSATTSPAAASQVEAAVRRLLNEEQDYSDRRSAPRNPFFRPISMTWRFASQERRVAFTRELSSSGIGLLHAYPVSRGEVLVTVSSEHGDPVLFRVYLLWCRPCGEGWYLSGGQILGLGESGG
jgi:hypothetical protein